MGNKRGQSVIEYSLLIMLLIAAYLSMQMYIKRGIQGRWKDTIDGLGEQYDPTDTVSNVRHTLLSNSVTDITIRNDAQGFFTDRHDTSSSIEQKSGARLVGP